ncbi:hypothetical protein ABZZ74_50545, partial [Streptomyces sp. NPDC006476]
PAPAPDAVVHTEQAGRELFVHLPVPDTDGVFASWVFESAAHPRDRLTPLTGDLPGPLRGLYVHTTYTTADGTAGPHAIHRLTDLESTSATAAAAPLPPSLTGSLPDGFTIADPTTGHGWHFDAWGRLRYHDTPAPAGTVLRADTHAPNTPRQYLIPATLLPAWPHQPHTHFHTPVPHGLQIRATAHPGDTSTPAAWALDLLTSHGHPATTHALLFDGTQLHLTTTGNTQPQPVLGAPPASGSATGAPPADPATDPFDIDMDLDIDSIDFDPTWLDSPSPPGEPAIPPAGDSGAEAAGPSSRGLPDSDVRDRIPGLPGEGAAGSVLRPSQPDRPVPPPAAGLPRPGADRAAVEILQGLLDRLEKRPSELARRLLTSGPYLLSMRRGGIRPEWLPRLKVLEKIAPQETDWRLVPTAHSGFAVALRRGQDIAHFHSHGAFSHWAMALPGTGHQLELKDPEGPEGSARLVDADGTTEIEAHISTGDRGELRVHQPGRGEWWVDRAEHVVRGYRRAPGAPDPAHLLFDWSRTPGQPALDNWQASLETHRLPDQTALARFLGLDRKPSKGWKELTEGVKWRVRVAAYLTSLENIGNWRIETVPKLGFKVVFGAGTTLHFQQGEVVAWKVGLPGTNLQVHYDPPARQGQDASWPVDQQPQRLETLDGGFSPPGWELRVEDDRSVTVSASQAAAAGGPQWRLSAQRTLDSFTLPPADPANPSPFRRLTNAGVLPPTPHREPHPTQTTPATAPHTDLPAGSPAER